jgi:V8-like Glu-specific endopeptidase
MKRILLSSVLFLFVHLLSAQIVTDEQPTGLTLVQSSLSRNVIVYGDTTVQILSAPDRTVIAMEDSIADSQSGPLRFAYPVEVNYTLYNSGIWQVLANGDKLWTLKVKLPRALSTNALYDKFWLPEGAKFFVYSEDTGQSIGAVTSEYIGGSYEEPISFATGLIYEETVIFEYYQPASVIDSAVISISRIDYGYRHIKNPYGMQTQSFGDAANCNININCTEGNDWQVEKQAVARIAIPTSTGTGWCSCALINNTNNDNTPYVLTANHCLSGLDAIDNNNASLWTFYWDYEHSGCNNSTTEPTLKMTTGATVVANNSVSDFALLQLTQNPRNLNNFMPYYLGWDRTGNTVTSGAGIHHPKGDVKKISQANQIQNHTSQIIWGDGTILPANTYWNITFYNGLIEGGSSGSPFLNNNHHIIGQLCGGYDAICNTNYSKFYGQFSVSWTSNGATDNRRMLQPWLDPEGTNATTLDGIEAPTISGASTICATSVAYTLSPGTATSWNVTPASAFSITASDATSATVTASNYAGQSGTLTAVVNGSSITKAIQAPVQPMFDLV